jgi:hypothetical protein
LKFNRDILGRVPQKIAGPGYPLQVLISFFARLSFEEVPKAGKKRNSGLSTAIPHAKKLLSFP